MSTRVPADTRTEPRAGGRRRRGHAAERAGGVLTQRRTHPPDTQTAPGTHVSMCSQGPNSRIPGASWRCALRLRLVRATGGLLDLPCIPYVPYLPFPVVGALAREPGNHRRKCLHGSGYTDTTEPGRLTSELLALQGFSQRCVRRAVITAVTTPRSWDEVIGTTNQQQQPHIPTRTDGLGGHALHHRPVGRHPPCGPALGRHPGPLPHAPPDPIVRWTPCLTFGEPDWLSEPHGRDVLKGMRWLPFVTFWQVILTAAGTRPGNPER